MLCLLSRSVLPMKRAAMTLQRNWRSIGQHFGNGLHHFVRVVAHLPPFAWRSNIKSIASWRAFLQRLVNALLIFPTAIVCGDPPRVPKIGVEPSSPDGCPNFVRCESFVRLCRGDCARITPAHPYTIGLEGLPFILPEQNR